MGETARSRPTGIRPYGRSWQRPGVTPDHWPLPRRRTRMSWRGSWLGEVRGGGPFPGTSSREPQGCIVCSELAGDHGNLGRRSRRTVPATSRRAGRKVIHDYPRHFPEFLPLASSRRRAAGSPTGAASRRDTGRRRGPGARARAAPRHDGHGPNPRPPAQIRSNLPRGATRSSTARYFILDRIKVTYLYFCAAGGHWSGGPVALAVHPFEQQFRQSALPARTL